MTKPSLIRSINEMGARGRLNGMSARTRGGWTRILAGGSAAVLAVAALPAAAQVAMTPRLDGPPVLSVSVSESVEAAPDVALLTTGVQTRAPTANEAMRANAEQMEKLIAAVKSAGIPAKDIQTSGINLSPQYDYGNRNPDGSQAAPRFLGYEASNQVRVKSRRIRELGPLLDKMVAAGATNLSGPSFMIDEPAPLEDRARLKALETAKARADFYARAAGYARARLLSISEGGGNVPMPVMMSAARRDFAEAAKTPVEPGEVSARASLTVQFALEN